MGRLVHYGTVILIILIIKSLNEVSWEEVRYSQIGRRHLAYATQGKEGRVLLFQSFPNRKNVN